MSESSPQPRWKRPYAIACVVLVAGLLVGGLVVRLTTSSAPSRPECSAASERLSGVWDEQVRAQVNAAFSRNKMVTRADALDEYARQWARAHATSCRAGGELSAARAECLTERRDGLAALTLLLARADKAVLANATKLTAGLAPVGQCEEAAYLRSLPKPPTDPELARRSRELRARLRYVLTLFRAGKHADASAALTELLPEASKTGYAPIEAYARRVADEIKQRQR